VASPYVGEIRMFAGNFAPAGWALCQGQLMPISEFDTLFVLIGTTYGGDGQETFALPNLQSRVPVHAGQGQGLTTRVLGEAAGTEVETLTIQQIPSHTHTAVASSNVASTTVPSTSVTLASSQTSIVTPYGSDEPVTNLSPNTIGPVGGSQPHENTQPFLCVNFIISLYGVFPTQN
jgi:microcystin-dependent protein